MTALPADVSKYTNDGQILYAPVPATQIAIKALHPDARVMTTPAYTFFDNPADAQTMLNEKASFLTEAYEVHVGIQIRDSIDIGTAIPIAPFVPCFTVVDADNNINVVARCRSVAHDFDGDQYAVEVLA